MLTLIGHQNLTTQARTLRTKTTHLGLAIVKTFADGLHDLSETFQVLGDLLESSLFLLCQQLLDALVQDALVKHVQLPQFTCRQDTQLLFKNTTAIHM